jgi:drug/metabolite transporter (DMT)-like permease|tara:strand:- start:15034 stop:15288 length:255 start_codon:yes stop_codon:yes gene_type:complete
LLKLTIIGLMLALLASLGSGFYFLMVDQGDKNSRRTFHSLGVRLTLALALAGLIIFGVATGKLGHSNPWDAGPRPAAQAQESGE